MGKQIVNMWNAIDRTYKIAYWFCLVLSAGLIITGFFCPPLAVIDNSVIISVGELWGFAAIGVLIRGIDSDKIKSFKHKDTEIEFHESIEKD